MLKRFMLVLSCAAIAPSLAARTTGVQEATNVVAGVTAKRNDVIFTADGRRLGRIDAVRGGQAFVIVSGRYLPVPVNTLSVDGKRLKTSLGFAEIVRR